VEKTVSEMEHEMGKKLIFVVDDDPVIRTSLQRYLVKMGYEVKAIEDGFNVLVMLDYFKPDLIISDIRMPKLDGISLLKGIRNRDITSQIPIIFISGYSEDEIVNQALELGAKFFLFKPFPLEYLGEMVANILPEEYSVGLSKQN
jgi:CheY-like chemotaxis protein